MATVWIDTASDILYSSFYIKALQVKFKNHSIHFTSVPFKDLSLEDRLSVMLFIIKTGNTERRFAIDMSDQNHIHQSLYDWSDIYGHVNCPLDNHQEKLKALCPSFGVRCWDIPSTIRHIHLASQQNTDSLRKIIGKHYRMLRRPQYEDYLTAMNCIDNNFVFHCSTLWKSDEWNRNDETVNLTRARFIRAVKSINDLQFEGGLVSHRKDYAANLFDDCLTHSYSANKYLQLSKRSAFVFNTPAYWGCHGWKLGEYMAMGKAILSTRLHNALPAPLVHGFHIHIIENTIDSISDGIQYMYTHPDYCQELGENIHNYWEQYGSPLASLNLLGIE